jgi:hypothetical protein
VTVKTSPELYNNLTPDMVLRNPQDYTYNSTSHVWTYSPRETGKTKFGESYTYYPNTYYLQNKRKRN